jgi:hypothetical protein
MAVKPIALSLLPYMWTAWWRKLKQKGVWHGANTATVMAFAFLGFFSVTTGSIIAFRSLNSGSTAQGMMLLEMGLNAAMMGWLIIPVMVGSTTAEGRGVQPTRMGQFPLGNGDLLAIGILGRLVQPVYWILAGTSLIALLPLLAVTRPTAGLIAGALFIVFSAMLAWSIELFGSALFSSRRGREMMMLGVLLLSLPIIFIIMGEFNMPEGNITFSIHDHSWLLLNAEANEGLFTKARVVSPSVWVSGAADGSALVRGLLLLGLAAGLSCALAMFSLRRVMLHPPGSLRTKNGAGRAIGNLGNLPAETGAMVIKELRYLTRTLDHLMGVGMGLIALVWILIRPEHLVYVLSLGAMNIVVNESAIPLNTFGLDGSGADRYRLLPLSGRQVMLTKNLAYFIIVGIHLAPLFIGGLVLGEALLVACTMLATGAVCLLTAIGGNFTSVRSPAPRAFYNFDSKEQTGGGLALGLAILVWVVPTGVFFGLYWVGLWASALGLLFLMVGSWFLYRTSLGQAGIKFEDSAETMRDRLSKE